MKKNVILFSIIVFLATFTYYFQEVGDKKKKVERENEGRVLDPEKLGLLRGFDLPEVEVSKQGSQYLIAAIGQLADERKVSSFMQQLAGIKVKRKLSPDEISKLNYEEVFPNPNLVMTFLFSQKKVSFRLGRKLDFDRSFYMEVIQGDQKDIVVAFDSSDVNGVYTRGDSHRADHHYKRFQSLFSLKRDYFLDYRLFRSWMTQQWSLKAVEIDNTRNKAFKIHIVGAQTLPKVPNGLRLQAKAVREFEKKIALLEGESFGPDNKLSYSESVVSIIKVSSTRGSATLKLLRDRKETEQFYIHSSLDNFYYKVSKKIAKIFQGHVQEFWDLRYLPKRPESISFKFGSKFMKANLKSVKGRFQATSDDGKAIHLNIKKLSDLLSSSAAYWVVDKNPEHSYIKQFELDWGQGPFFLMIRAGELLVYDSRMGEGLVYKFSGKPPIGLVEGDYFL